MAEKIEAPWESEIPLTCRRCDNGKYQYALAHENHKLRAENEAIRAAMRDAIRSGNERVREAVREWCGG